MSHRVPKMSSARSRWAGGRLLFATTAYNTVEKVAGLALIDANAIAVVNDNDFGVAGISIDNTTGTYTLLPDYVPETDVVRNHRD